MIKAILTWEADCEICHRTEKETLMDTWFASRLMDLSEEELTGQDFIDTLEGKGWEFRRESYEDLNPYCPNCKKVR